MKMIDLEKNERLDDLQYNDLKIVQNKELYCFSSDAVLLCNFVKAKASDVIVDLCSGSGIVGILAQAKNHAKKVILVEKQEALAKICKKTIEYNELQSKVDLINADILDVPKILGIEKYDVVCSNPPYFLPEGKYLSGNPQIDIAKFEIEMNFEKLCMVASKLLKYAGKFYFISDSSRICELIVTLKKYDLEPKIIEFVFPKSNKHSNVVLFECIKKGKPGAKVYNKFIGD